MIKLEYKLFCILLTLGFICVFIFSGTTFASEVEDSYNVLMEEIDEDLCVYKILKTQNNSSFINSSVKKEDLKYNFLLDENLLEMSSEVIVQEEKVKPKYTLITDKGEVEVNNVATKATSQGSWSDDEGYLTILTMAYKLGTSVSGSTKYAIKSEIKMHKTFKLRYQEELIIRHSSNAAFDDSYAEKGSYGYHTYSTHTGRPTVDTDVINNLSVAKYNIAGVNFNCTFPIDQNVGGGGVKIYSKHTNWWVKGEYGITVSGDTNVQTTYLHNENLFGANLSFSISYYGVSLNISGRITEYPARPITIYK